MKYYKALMSHKLSFKFMIEENNDANKIIRDQVHSMNKGEAKSDKIIVHRVKSISRVDYINLNLPEKSYQLI